MGDLKTAEFVSPAHPDKMCDQISDLVLDTCLEQDKNSRVAIETMIGHWEIKITWELTTTAEFDYREIVNKVLLDNRYEPNDYELEVNVVKQSQFIANWVDKGWAWDQWIMVWYATRETENFMPFEYEEARQIIKELWEKYPECRDAKSQVTTNDWKITTIVVSAERMKTQDIEDFLKERYKWKNWIKFFVNPCWERDWWPDSDAGVTGRKLVVDNYGPQVPIWWWAFSWKDPSKVDRSWAYMARYLAVKTLEEHKDFDRVWVKIAYSIGVAEPVMVEIRTPFWPMEYSWEPITPEYIKRTLWLLDNVKYYETAKRGHFWNGFNWK